MHASADPRADSVPVVLVVDDEPDVRDLVASVLSNAGLAPLLARDGEEAVDLLRRKKGRIDVILTDVMMPVVDGPTLARRVAREWPDLPVLFMTGYPADTLEALGLLSLETPRIEKPVGIRKLVGSIRKALDVHRGPAD